MLPRTCYYPLYIDTIQGYWNTQSQDFIWLLNHCQQFLICNSFRINELSSSRSGGALRDHRLSSDTPCDLGELSVFSKDIAIE